MSNRSFPESDAYREAARSTLPSVSELFPELSRTPRPSIVSPPSWVGPNPNHDPYYVPHMGQSDSLSGPGLQRNPSTSYHPISSLSSRQGVHAILHPTHEHPPHSLYHSQHLQNQIFQSSTNSTLSDLEEAIELHRAALAFHPSGHYLRSSSLNDLTSVPLARFHQRGVSSDLEEAFRLYSRFPQVSHAISRRDLRAAKSWAASAKQLNHNSVLVAYQTTLKFLDQHIALLSSSSRHFNAVRVAASSLAMDAFSCSIRQGASTTAVELVEQGRAVFWTQLSRFRTPVDELSASGDTGVALAKEFRLLSFRLHNAVDASTEDQSAQIRQLTARWDDVISRIRMLPDFSQFLLPPLFSELRKAAEDGPVIIVNASQYSCDALIILSAQDPVHIPLGLALTEVSQLSSEFQSLIHRAGSSDHRLESHKLVGVLRKLWDGIVGPILQVLKKFIRRGSRIWWCPTAEFTLLPLHAAGPYEPHSRNFSHFYISSYTPTLAALIRARQQPSRGASVEHFVAIGQANPAGGNDLRCVAAELDVVAQRVAPFISFTSLADGDATVQGTLDALEFAFLSACDTTVGDESSPDEAIHLVAAIQFSGFRSVIGSMWSVDDDVAGQIVSLFYENLVDDSGRLDCRRAAGALHKAVNTLRKKIPFEQQIVFVHIGI
ncbi:hypothetical protein EDB19DRAFT_2035383 [Suillus lakei]|nr:hypothetical protein EDB19DRAFT_2035383 [Suillus lakei]